MMYFRYRGATKGAEQFCYGILDADNVKRRKFYEVQSFFRDIKNYDAALKTPIRNQVAIVYDYDSLASFRIQKQSILLDPAAEMQKFYKPFFDVNVGVDVIPEDRDFSKYQVLILPQMIIHKPEMEAKVKAFAEQGGTVVLTYRCSVKDANNNVPFGKTAPVGYNEFAGHCVVETESLQTLDAFPVVGTGAFAKYNGMGGIFRDMIEVKDAEILFRYGDTFYDSFAAVTRKPAGKGMVYYIGCGLEESITKALMETIMKEKEIPMYPSQNGVEIVTRGEKEQQIKMYINHNGTEAEEDGVKLAPFECVIKSIN